MCGTGLIWLRRNREGHGMQLQALAALSQFEVHSMPKEKIARQTP